MNKWHHGEIVECKQSIKLIITMMTKSMDPETKCLCLSLLIGSESVQVSVDISMGQKEFSVP